MWGRKVTMLIAAVFFSVSGIGCAFSDSLEQLVFARMLGGIGIGIVSVVSPLYISEVSIAQYRGRLVALYQLAITIGFLGAYLTNLQLLICSEWTCAKCRLAEPDFCFRGMERHVGLFLYSIITLFSLYSSLFQKVHVG